MGPGDCLPALLVFVNSPMYTFSPSSLFAYRNPNNGYDFSIDKGSFPNEVLACLESRAYAKAVKPMKYKRLSITSKSKWLGLFFLLLFLCHIIFQKILKFIYSI